MESLRVLIVEDEPIIALSVAGALADAGHIVSGIAGTQAEAIELAAAEPPDCAVADVRLAVGDGRLVAKTLAEKGVAVLLATAQCYEVKDLAHSGALGCLPKPYSPSDVPAALRAICLHRQGGAPADLPDHMFLLDAA